jgi:hypothetical protein
LIIDHEIAPRESMRSTGPSELPKLRVFVIMDDPFHCFQARINDLSAQIKTESLRPEDQINKQLLNFLISERQELYLLQLRFARERQDAGRPDAPAMQMGMGGMRLVAAQPVGMSYD